MREGLEAVFRSEDGERPRAILVGIEDGSGETEQMLDCRGCSIHRAERHMRGLFRRAKSRMRGRISAAERSRSCASCARAGASRRWCLIPSCLLLR